MMSQNCISKHTVKELDECIIHQNIILLKKIANDYNLEHQDFIKEIMSDYMDIKLIDKELSRNNKITINKKRCMSRIWNQGYGGQCTRYCQDSKDYCKIHQREIICKSELRYGRIDQISKFRLNKKLDEPYLRCIHYKIDVNTNKRIQCTHRMTNKENKSCGIHSKK